MREGQVAFLGTSPSMSFVIERVARARECVVFNSGRIGGAWAESRLGGLSVPRAINSIIFHATSDQNAYFLADFEADLLRRGAILKSLPPMDGGQSKRESVGRIMPVVFQTLRSKSVILVRREVRRVEVFLDRVLIDGETFEALYLPENFAIPEFYVSGVQKNHKPVSKTFAHFRAKFKNPVVAPYLDRDWDSRFDRGGMQYPGQHVFVGRVRREWEERPEAEELIRGSDWLNPLVANIEAFDLPRYTIHRRTEDDLSRLRDDLEGSAARLVPTGSLIDSYVFSREATQGFEPGDHLLPRLHPHRFD